MSQPSPNAIAAYLRVASMAVAIYDYLETFPKTCRFYKEHYRSRRISLSSWLFVLLRGTSVMVLALSNVGFFYGKFTLKTCKQFFYLPAVFKVLQVMVSQVILGVRAWNLSRRSRAISYFLPAAYVIVCVVEWISTLYKRKFKLGGEPYGNCSPFSAANEQYAWIFYAAAVTYDSLATAISVTFLLKYKQSSNNSIISKLTRMMLYDGIGYFIALAAVNVLNLMLYKQDRNVQTAGASLAYCLSWIMSQRLLIHLYEATCEHRGRSEAVTITQNIDSPCDISRVVRTQFEEFEPKDTSAFSLTVPDTEFHRHPDLQHDAGVQVRIERTVKLDRRLKTIELENYSRNGGPSVDMTKGN